MLVLDSVTFVVLTTGDLPPPIGDDESTRAEEPVVTLGFILFCLAAWIKIDSPTGSGNAVPGGFQLKP